MKKGMLIVLAGPSGVGKGTLGTRLLNLDPNIVFSVSATTRPPRPGEINHVHYDFLSNEEFDSLLAQDAFLEHAQVHGNRYGTLKTSVESAMQGGKDVLLDIDVQGALNVMRLMPDAVTVFIQPPSFAELERRLRDRNTETPEALERRLHNAREEIAQANRFHYTLINDDLETAFADLSSIISAERHNTVRYLPTLD